MEGLQRRIYLAVVLATFVCVAVEAKSIGAFVANGRRSSAFLSTRKISNGEVALRLSRGGGADVEVNEDEDEDEYDLESDDEMEEEDEEEEEDDEEEVTSLSKSAVSAAKKSTKKATSASKATVNASLKTTKKKASKSIGEILHIPYIVRSCMNPLTVLAMTRGYFASLFNINYLDQFKESSQGLRSALEAKARKEASSASSSPKKGKKTMRPGQAKSLSDLPALSA